MQQPLTTATQKQLFGIQALAAVNAVLVLAAWSAVTAPAAIGALLAVSPAAPVVVIKYLLPFFSFYALLYELGPLVRWIANAFRNHGITKENEARRAAAWALYEPSPELRRKLQRARALGSSRNIAAEPVAFDSARSDSRDTIAAEADSWDRRFRASRR